MYVCFPNIQHQMVFYATKVHQSIVEPVSAEFFELDVAFLWLICQHGFQFLCRIKFGNKST